jgi:hypothetical protein
MTLDKKYFDEKIHQLYSSEYADVPRIEILIQIASDAAEGQRINCSAACALRMKGRVDANCKCGEIYCTAKLEIPHA